MFLLLLIAGIVLWHYNVVAPLGEVITGIAALIGLFELMVWLFVGTVFGLVANAARREDLKVKTRL